MKKEDMELATLLRSDRKKQQRGYSGAKARKVECASSQKDYGRS